MKRARAAGETFGDYYYHADRYAQLSGTAFSVVIVMALTGGMVLPYVTGVLGASYGLRGSFVIVPVALVLLALLAAGRVASDNRQPTAAS